MLTRLLAGAIGVLIGATMLQLGTAHAAPGAGCKQTDALTGVCLIWANSGADTSAEIADEASVGSGSVVEAQTCSYELAKPQPAATNPVWEGHKPDEGAIWLHVCAAPLDFGSDGWVGLIFIPKGSDPAVEIPVAPRLLAQQAVSSMVLRAPHIRMAPPPEAHSALVGMPIWLWAERGQSSTGPEQASASAGAITVTAVASVTAVVWDMGDGHEVICGLGTPYEPGASGRSPDCGYVYESASSRHGLDAGWPITATSTWTITWTGGGQSGTETLDLSSSAELVVGEMQVLNQDGSTQ